MSHSKILVPYDGSASSQSAVKFAVEMAAAFGDEVVLLNVQASLDSFNTKQFFSLQQIHEYEQEKGNAVLQSGLDILAKTDVSYLSKVRTGTAKEEIIKEAKDSRARCIVMGSRGMDPFVGKILGSVSYGVLHTADCPVVIVPEPEI